jgi:hypothetical protein
MGNPEFRLYKSDPENEESSADNKPKAPKPKFRLIKKGDTKPVEESKKGINITKIDYEPGQDLPFKVSNKTELSLQEEVEKRQKRDPEQVRQSAREGFANLFNKSEDKKTDQE